MNEKLNDRFFRFEYVIKTGTILETDGVVQIGFVNIGERPVYVNNLEMRPVPDPQKFAIASWVLWLPINSDENDRTRYQVKFDETNPALKSNLLVIYKMRERG